MLKRFANDLTLAWLLLVAITCLSWETAIAPAGGSRYHLASLAVISIAFIKVRIVILHFMEVRHAPLPVRLFCEAWVLVLWIAINVMYWLQAHAPA